MAPSPSPPPEKLPLSRSQIVLRIMGGTLLTACALMVVLGSTIFAERLSGLRFIFYWTWCLLLTCAAIVIALWDMLLVRRTSQRTRRELFQREFMRDDLGKRPRKHEGR
jgi:hypothetical protein